MDFANEILDAVNTAEIEFHDGNYEKVVQLCAPFVKNRTTLPPAYIYCALGLMELAAIQTVVMAITYWGCHIEQQCLGRQSVIWIISQSNPCSYAFLATFNCECSRKILEQETA